jgi:hypothetical protein
MQDSWPITGNSNNSAVRDVRRERIRLLVECANLSRNQDHEINESLALRFLASPFLA